MYKLLIVDDELLALESLVESLDWNELGFEVVGAYTDSEKALRHIEQYPVDVLMSDIKMPNPDGIELAKFCHEKYPNINVVLISAYREFEYAQIAIRYNVRTYLVKPITYSALYDAMKTLSEQLDSENYKSDFPDGKLFLLQQDVFSDILCANIKDIDILKDKLQTIELSENLVYSPCVLINIHIHEFANYLSNTWKHEKSRLYNAINLLAHFESPEAYFSMARYSYNNIELIGISKIKGKGDFLGLTCNYIKQLKKNLLALLNLTCNISIVHQTDELQALMEEDISLKYIQSSQDNHIVTKTIEYINNNYANDISLDDVAKYVSLSRVYFSSCYKRLAKESFVDTLNKIRIEKATEILKKGDIKVSMVHELVGYKSMTYFYKLFKTLTNFTPAEYQNQFKKDAENEQNS